MLKLSSKEIVIVDRQRREFEPARLQELVKSIGDGFLQNAPVVRRLADGRYQLVSGERRIRAVDHLHFLGRQVRYGGAVVPAPFIPCVDVGELDPLAAKEAEYDENDKRTDISWQEKAAAMEGIQELRKLRLTKAEQSGDHKAIVAAEKAISVAAIAEDKGKAHNTVRMELIVAKHLANPEVKAAKSLEEAFKVLKRQEDVSKRRDLAAVVGRTFSASLHEAHHADSIKWMKDYADAQLALPDPRLFDVILTDPPYGMGADTFGDSGGKAAGAHSYDDSYEAWKALIPAFARESARITRSQAHLYAFCDLDRFHEFKGYLEDEGWDVFRTPLVWFKPSAARLPWVDFGPQRKYELCIYACKGRRPVNLIAGDVLTFQPDDNMGHQAQKPVALFADLLRRSVAPGNLVLDPFAGSGTIFPAAHEHKCKAVGIEQAAEHYALCLKRLESLKAQGELPV